MGTWLENVFWLDEVFACSTAIRIGPLLALRICRLHEALSARNRLKMNPDDQKCPSGQ